MNDPDDLYFTTYGELVEGQKYRMDTAYPWTAKNASLEPVRSSTTVIQAQRWVPEPVMVTVPADLLERHMESSARAVNAVPTGWAADWKALQQAVTAARKAAS